MNAGTTDHISIMQMVTRRFLLGCLLAILIVGVVAVIASNLYSAVHLDRESARNVDNVNKKTAELMAELRAIRRAVEGEKMNTRIGSTIEVRR